MNKPIKKYILTLEVEVFNIPYCEQDIINHVRFFNEIHNPACNIKIEEIKQIPVEKSA